MTAVVLRPLGDATYAVRRGGVDTEVVVIATFLGWIGQEWLDSLTAEMPR